LSCALTEHNAMNTHGGMEVQLHAFVTSTLDGGGQPHVPAALPSGKERPLPIRQRLGGSQSRSGRGDKEKNSQPLPGIESRSSSP
jgi:hypothetical protein